MSLGTLIAIDGIDGAGKTTLARRLSDAVLPLVESFLTKEPTDGPWGAQLRDSASSGRHNAEYERFLLTMDRKEHVADVIQPALNRGIVVVLDRYVYSTAAYQSDSDEEAVEILNEQFLFAPVPDITFIVDTPVETALSRIKSRGDTANHFERTDTLERCRRVFTGVVAMRPEVVLLDGAESPDEVFAAAIGHLARRWPKFEGLYSDPQD